MKTLTVNLDYRSYPIFIGQNLLGDASYLKSYIKGQQVMIVSNETVAPLYLERLLPALEDLETESVILPDGEEYKTLETANIIYTALLENRFERKCTLIALGGGVVGDITGFVAATYQRGVNFIQIPTTLLAQVDSSVGGKTGVNHPLGKNMIGAFHQPQCVVIDTNTLDTLPDNELSAGLAEVIKYGLIRDQEFFIWLQENMPSLRGRDPEKLAYAIERSCQNKKEVVAADEKESGQRALLNLGHTFGHAIEAGMGYGKWLHGEAVGIGMLMAADLSYRSGWLDKSKLEQIKSLLHDAGLPVKTPPEMSTERFLELMAVDKKVVDGKIRLILLKDIGNSKICDDYDPNLLRKTLDEFHRAAN